MAASNLPVPAPYPGLRAFRKEEASIFCGRAQHRLEILDALAESRFLAVVGASGSGKSSLVLAGVLPDICGGQLIGVDPKTVRVASMQPGSQPFQNLANALAEVFPNAESGDAVLRRGPLGVVQFLDHLMPEFDGALVLVVDQFEEIFRFSDRHEGDVMRELGREGSAMLDGTLNESQAFVNLLIETSKQSDYPVYVMLTMRSEFLKDCDRFSGLPEAISRSQFLTPRLNRDQLEQAVTRPLAGFNASMEPALVNLILNRISTEQDQLPRMQHALARMWEVSKSAAGKTVLSVKQFEEVGGLSDALNNHGDSICAELENQGVPLSAIEQFFRATAHHVSADVAPVRRPVKLGQIVAETGLPLSVVQSIADAFRAEGAHLLMPPTTKIPSLGADNFVDISHESLLRQWRRMKGWMEKEWQQRKMAGELVEAMESWKKNAQPVARNHLLRVFLTAFKIDRHLTAGEAVATRLYRDAKSSRFTEENSAPMEAWAARYGIQWKDLAAFCKMSFAWKKRLDTSVLFGTAVVALAGLLFYASLYAFYQTGRAKKESARANAAAAEAQKEAANASKQTEIAQQETANAIRATSEAQKNLQNAVDALSEKDADLRSVRAALSGISAKIEAGHASLKGSSPETADKLKDLFAGVAVQAYAQIGAVQSTPDNALPPLGSAPAFTSALVLKSGFPQTASKPKVAFLDHYDGLMLIAGTEGYPKTLLWNLTGGDGNEVVFQFESTRLKSVDGGKRVLSEGITGKRMIVGPDHSEQANQSPNEDAQQKFVFWQNPQTPVELRLSASGTNSAAAILRHQSPVKLPRALSRDGTMLATTDDQGRVYLWLTKYAPEKIPPPVVLSGHKLPPSILRWAPDDRFLITADDEGVSIVWQSPRDRIEGRFSELPFVLPPHPGGVTDAAISTDLRRIATTGADRIIRVFPIVPTIRGTAREWGGPNDLHGKDGDLALLTANDAKSDAYRKYFLPEQPSGTKGLIKRLNPESYYVNSRWDYSVTPRSVLRRTVVRIRKIDADGKPSANFIEAQAVDWGPPSATGFACDVSPAIIKKLQLKPTDTVELEIPLLEVRRSETRKSAN